MALAMTSLRAELGLVLTTLLWGLTFPLLRVVVQTVPPPWVVAIRFSITFLVFVPIALTHGRARIASEAKKNWKGALLLGFLAFASYLTQTEGLQTISAGRTAFITGTSVVIVPLLSPLFGPDRPQRSDWIACLGAVAGLFLLTRPDLGGGSLKGDLWVLACSVICAFYIRFLPAIAKRSESQHTLNLMQIGAVAVMAWTTLPLSGGAIPTISRDSWIGILILATFLTTGTFSLQTSCQAHTTPERAAIIFAMEPVWGSLFGFLLLGESFTPSGYLGAALILASVLGLELWNWRQRVGTVLPRSTA
jgi:drug/metabolite transporter (DMT)-like permease